MDDINFDELDKAVNSALKKTEPKEDSRAEDTTVASSGAGLTDPVAPVASVAPPVVVPKRRGQFMDMVHPSSDMIKTSPQRTNRQAATIEPLNPSIIETAAEPSDKETPVAAEPSTDVAPVATEPAVHSEWPDPLDVMEQTAQEKHEIQEDEPEESADKVSDSAPEEETAEPTVSPFITGTSPEKRPLGAFADAPSAEEEDADEVVETPDEDAEQTSESTSEVDHQVGDFSPEPLPVVPVPQELTPEVVSVESDEPLHQAEDADEKTISETNPMAASIPRQYKNSEVPPEDQADHPVFDTRDYHQPLTPPAKKGHTAAIVTIVLLLLVALGVGAWYAVAVLKLI